MSNQQVDAAMRIVEIAPRASVNAVVWNQLLAMLGREGRMEKMWKVYNDVRT
jgi:pentatricopeptide repeat protein